MGPLSADTLEAAGNVIVCMPPLARGHVSYFAKNSDREVNEESECVFFPRAAHVDGKLVDCTYVSVPQIAQTNGVLLCKPKWMWGAEMGANDQGLAMGCQVVCTVYNTQRLRGLTPMDVVRLVLERTATARAAVDEVTRLLWRYGLGGDIGFAVKVFEDASFVITDCNETWIVELIGRDWAARRIREGSYVVGNALTLQSSASLDRKSSTLVPEAVVHGWCDSEDEFSLRLFNRTESEAYAASSQRVARIRELLRECGDTGRGVTTRDMIAILRDHGVEACYEPHNSLRSHTVCMHVSSQRARRLQTTNSLVVELHPNGHVLCWVTGTSAPCLSVFVPLWLHLLDTPGSVFATVEGSGTLWWHHELLHRRVVLDFVARSIVVQNKLEALERRIVTSTRLVRTDGERRQVMDNARREVGAWVHACIRDVERLPVQQGAGVFFVRAWQGFNDKHATLNPRVSTEMARVMEYVSSQLHGLVNNWMVLAGTGAMMLTAKLTRGRFW